MIEEVLERKLKLHFKKGVRLETLCDNLAVLGQRVYNFLDELGIGHYGFKALFFAISCRSLGRLDERFADLRQLLFESICDRLQTLLKWAIQPVQKLQVFEVVLVKERTDSTFLIIQQLCLVLYKDLFLENHEELLVKVWPAKTFLKACLL